jgi:hypothetical protein
MKEKLTRKVAVIVGTAVVALGATGYAVAQSGNNSRDDERKAFLNDAAQRLDVTPEKLTKALQDAAIARIDAAQKAGRLTEEQANEMKAHVRQGGGLPFLGGPGGPGGHGGPGHHGGGPRAGMTAAAKYLGLTEAELHAKLEGGKSLADVAKAENKSVDGLKAAIEKAVRADIAKAVTDKKLTQAQADEILKDLKSRIAGKVARKGDEHRRGGPGRGHGGPGGPPPGGPPPGGPGFGPPPAGPPPPADEPDQG